MVRRGRRRSPQSPRGGTAPSAAGSRRRTRARAGLARPALGQRLADRGEAERLGLDQRACAVAQLVEVDPLQVAPELAEQRAPADRGEQPAQRDVVVGGGDVERVAHEPAADHGAVGAEPVELGRVESSSRVQSPMCGDGGSCACIATRCSIVDHAPRRTRSSRCWRASSARLSARRPRMGASTASHSADRDILAVGMVIFSGIQPTGRKHLGNYIGAIRQYVEGQDRADPSIYCIVDLHAIDRRVRPGELRERVYDTTAILMAAGLDPERCILFRQGDVQEHTELCWLLTSRDVDRRAQPDAPVPRQVGRAAPAASPRGCCSTRSCRPPTCSPTARTRCPWGRTSASTWS